MKPPLVAVHVVHEAEHCRARPEWGEERNAILHVDHGVERGRVTVEAQRRPEVLHIGAPKFHDAVRTLVYRTAAEQRDVVAAFGKSTNEAVDQHLGTAGSRMREVTPCEDGDSERT
jgi:hypothetical protein